MIEYYIIYYLGKQIGVEKTLEDAKKLALQHRRTIIPKGKPIEWYGLKGNGYEILSSGEIRTQS